MSPANALAEEPTEVSAGPEPSTSRRRSQAFRSQESVVLGVAVVLALVLTVTVPTFRTLANLTNLLDNVAVLGILAVALSIVVVGRGFDLSLVAIMAVSVGLTMNLMPDRGLFVGLVIGLLLAAGTGLINGILVAYLDVHSIFATFTTWLALYGFGRYVLLRRGSGLEVSVPNQAHSLVTIASDKPLGVPTPVIALAVVAVIVSLVMRYTSAGRFLYAMGDNPDAARLIGIPVRLVMVMQYVVAAVIAFAAGLVLAAENHSMNLQIIDSSLIFNVFLVVVIGGVSLVGGRGGVVSAVVGTVLIGVLLNGLTLLDVPVQQQSMAEAAVFLLALALDARLHPRNEETARQGDI